MYLHLSWCDFHKYVFLKGFISAKCSEIGFIKRNDYISLFTEIRMKQLRNHWEKFLIHRFNTLFKYRDVAALIKWFEMIRKESRNAYPVLVGRPEGKRTLGTPRCRWKDKIKMDVKELGYGARNWMDLAENRDQWRAYVKAENEPPAS